MLVGCAGKFDIPPGRKAAQADGLSTDPSLGPLHRHHSPGPLGFAETPSKMQVQWSTPARDLTSKVPADSELCFQTARPPALSSPTRGPKHLPHVPTVFICPLPSLAGAWCAQASRDTKVVFSCPVLLDTALDQMVDLQAGTRDAKAFVRNEFLRRGQTRSKVRDCGCKKRCMHESKAFQPHK